MTAAMPASLRALLALAALALAVAVPLRGGALRRAPDDGRLLTADGDTVIVTDAARAAGLRFAPGVGAGDRAWVSAAIARARPEAARLIAEVDGLVTVGTFARGGDVLGVTSGRPDGFAIDLDVARLDGDRAGDRTTVVLHELGHVIDFALVPAALGERLDAAIPRGGACGLAIDCDAPSERFADTFAKWALNGAVAEIGAGYGVAMPASIEDWGAPLAQISYALPAA
jgi:hypothetical protein